MDNGDGTVTDLNTGLMWEKQSNDGSIHDKNATYSWADAFAVHIAGLNTMNFAGYNDWRVPNVKELQSIVNYETAIPAVAPAFNNSCTGNCSVLTCSCTGMPTIYWTSTTYVVGPDEVWNMSFINGQISHANKVNNFHHVRAVR
jgi:hypothetical protein